MSHRCGTNCRRKQTPSTKKDCPSCGHRKMPETITAGGRTRTVTQYMRNHPHLGITAKRVENVLENWLIRGIRTESDGRQSRCYIGVVPGLDEMVRVAVSMDDERIISAFQDRTATR